MSDDKRRRQLDRIEEKSATFSKAAEMYRQLRWKCEEEDASDCFCDLVEALGDMTLGGLSNVGDLAMILWKVGAGRSDD